MEEITEKQIPYPDFRTAGIIMSKSGIKKAYETGRGSITIRARIEIEENPNGTTTLIVKELPYQVNKAKLIEKIAELVRDKRIEGITELNDESDRNGMRVVMRVRREMNVDVDRKSTRLNSSHVAKTYDVLC